MKRDTLFYKIFQQSPVWLFELIAAATGSPEESLLLMPQPVNFAEYKFSSVEVKEFAFRIDGVFEPPTVNEPVLFVEVQMQRDKDLYERIHNESSTYIRQKKGSFRGWRVIVIYPSRKIEQTRTEVPEELFASGRFLPIYLDELGSIDELPIGLGLMVLTTSKKKEAVANAKRLIAKSRGLAEENAIMELVAEIMVYKFNQLSREEVDAMLDIRLEDTRVYQEAEAEGRAKERKEMVLMQLQSKLGILSDRNRSVVEKLSWEQMAELATALLNFQDVRSLESWLKQLPRTG